MPAGRISVTWEQRETPNGTAIELVWREQRGPKVKARRRKGFGSLVIEHNLARALDAKVEFAFEPDGLRCRVTIPPSQIVAAR